MQFERFADARFGEWRGYPETPLKRGPFHSALNEFLFTPAGTPLRGAVRLQDELRCANESAPDIQLIITPFAHKK